MEEKKFNFKEKFEKFIKSDYSIFLLLFLLELVLTIFITPNKYDDATFLGWVKERRVIDIVSERYFTWTSRVIIEFIFLSIFTLSKYVWVLIQALMMTLLGFSISKLFVPKDMKKKINPLVVLLVLCYPIDVMGSAGWAATTANYMWPLSTLLYALIPIKKAFDGEKLKIWEYPLYVLALIYSGNMEQSCAILVGTYLLFTIIYIIKNKKVNKFMCVMSILAIASMVFILTTPGNYARQEKEIAENFPDWSTLNFFDKVSLGFTVTLGNIIEENNLPFFLLSLCVCCFVVTKNKETLYRAISAIPVLVFGALGPFIPITYKLFPFFGSMTKLITDERVLLTAANSNNLFNALPVMISIFVFGTLLLSIMIAFKNLKNTLPSLIFLIGFASRMIMGFSPTVFASSIRTLIFFEFAMLIITLLICEEFIKSTDKYEVKIQKRLFIVIQILAVMQYLNGLIAVLATK